MGLFHRSDNHLLTAAPFELAVGRGRRRVLIGVLAILSLAALVAAGIEYFERQMAPALRVAELEKENARLREAGERADLALEMERATRSELERQVAELNQQVQQLNAELGFFKSRSRAP